MKNVPIELLKKLIKIPSVSRKEDKTADLLQDYLKNKGIEVFRKSNNLWCQNLNFNPELPSVLLNSHHDTVRPTSKWLRKPYEPAVEGDKLYGLGSNDAGGSLVALLFTFLNYYDKKDLSFNLIFAATAEEEISGENGIASILPDLGKIDLGIVGEPTRMQLAIAEKGLMVLDCQAKGKSGHAARYEGENAIYNAIDDIDWIRTFCFPKSSELLGEVKMTVTQIQAGTQHNVIPDQCLFVIDVRTNENYTNKEIYDIISSNLEADVAARSFRLNSSGIKSDHPLVMRGMELGLKCFGSPTLSDQALMDFPSVKIGPGDSARSHTADEYIHLSEINSGIEIYIKLLDNLKIQTI